MINLYTTHFFALFRETFETDFFVEVEISEVFSLKMQCHLISVAKAPE